MLRERKVDVIVVGQGIAGTVLTRTLLQNNFRVLVLDDKHRDAASMVAAGLYNPVVFRRLTKSWQAEKLLPVMEAFYRDLEHLLNVPLLHEVPIARILNSLEERNTWEIKSGGVGVGAFLGPTRDAEEWPVAAPHGLGLVQKAGYLSVVSLLKEYRLWLQEKGFLIESTWNFDDFDVLKEGVTLKIGEEVWQAERIIFCEGFKTLNNPFFNWLPMVPSKGDLLTIKAKGLPQDCIINAGIFLLPLGNDHFRVGSTFEWKDLSSSPSEKGKDELVQKLEKLLQVPFEVMEQRAGVRPTVKDRRPLIGWHPQQSRVGIFNGMGTKGVMLAPYFARQFVQSLNGNSPIDREVDIVRFSKLFPRHQA